jgi:ABC-2 type transport system permease protein
VNAARLFFVGGLISYRALFNWARPSIYIPTLLVSPLFQILFFAYLGRFSGVEDDAFFVVGNAVVACGMSSVYGACMAVANERWFGTLPSLLATPASRVPLFLGRALPFVANGVLVSAFCLVAGWLLLDFSPAAGSLAPLAAVLAVSVASCTGLGLLLGSVGLRARDVFFGANIAYFLMLLLCGVNIPLDTLPGWMETIGRGLPLTHGIEAGREVAAGASLADVGGLVGLEAAIGACYFLAAYGLFRLLELESRRRASLDRI